MPEIRRISQQEVARLAPRLHKQTTRLKHQMSSQNVAQQAGGGGFGGGLSSDEDSPPPKELEITFEQSNSKTKEPRRNEIWDACIEALGYEPHTDTEKRLWGKYTTSLRHAGATPDNVAAVASWYRRHWPGIDLTITALEKWYSHFLQKAEKKVKFYCDRCDLTFSTQIKLDDHNHNLHEED